MFFSVITKNLNWESLTKNSVTFKIWDGVKDEKFKYYGFHWKIRFLGGEGSRKPNQYIGGFRFSIKPLLSSGKVEKASKDRE